MPGIFLSSLDKKRKEDSSSIFVMEKHVVNSQEITPVKSRWTSQWKLLLLLLFFIPFFFTFWHRSPTRVFDLPLKHADFIGRDKELKYIEAQLLKKKNFETVNIFAVCGEGGIGKTELTIAFANNHLKDFSLIGWIDCNREETFLHSYAGIGDLLGIQEENPMKLREKVHSYLERSEGKPWLLIFDDIKEMPSHLPRCGGSVLISCRDKSICPPESVLELNKSPEDAVLLLSRLTKEKKSESLEKLAEKLDYLPLMINIAGHYIAETPGISLSDYSEILSSIIETERSPIHSIEFRKRYPRSLVATYQITLELLRKKHPVSLQFLKEAVFLHPRNIPVEYLTRWLEKQGNYSEAEVVLTKGDILRELQNHSLIRYDDQRGDFSIHQLLHKALMLEFKQEESASECLKIISKLEPVLRYNPTQKDTVRPFQKVLPQCIAVLDRIQVSDALAVKMALILTRYYFDTEHHLKKGEKYLLLAQKWAEGWDHPVKGRIAFLQGVKKLREGDQQKISIEGEAHYRKALTYFKEALEIFEQQNQDELYLGIEQNPSKCTKEYQRAISMQYQAQMLRLLGRLEEAKKGFQESLEAFQKIAKGKDHFDIARIVREQALILWEQGERELAIHDLHRVIEMQERIYGSTFSSQPTVAATYRILGDFYMKKGEYLRSDKAYEKAIEVNQASYQTDIHPYLADLYQQRSIVLAALGDKSRALKMEKKSQNIRSLLK
jgi:tetratricopeptide (TPR) repeat protein